MWCACAQEWAGWRARRQSWREKADTPHKTLAGGLSLGLGGWAFIHPLIYTEEPSQTLDQSSEIKGRTLQKEVDGGAKRLCNFEEIGIG